MNSKWGSRDVYQASHGQKWGNKGAAERWVNEENPDEGIETPFERLAAARRS